jgi:multicomponent Na+:H+ antiporter subunit C
VTVLVFATAGWLFLVGLWGVVRSSNLVSTAIAVGVSQSATYLLLLGIGYRTGATAPVFADVSFSSRAVDPVVQALTFVDVVVEAVVTGLLLAMAVQAARRHGTADPDALRPDAG